MTNHGPSAVVGATVADPFSAAITSDTFTATATGGATNFTANGNGPIHDLVNMPSGSMITYVITATLAPPRPERGQHGHCPAACQRN